MPRIDPEHLDHHELERVFLTPTLREASRAERLLDEHGLNYVIQVEPCGTSLLGSPRHGAAFYVSTTQAEYCRSKLTAAGMELGVLLALEDD